MVGKGSYDWTSFAVGLLVGGTVATFLGWRRRRRNRAELTAPPAQPPQLSSELKAQVLQMRAEGRVIEAIKLVRQTTGCDLKSAKDAVDALR